MLYVVDEKLIKFMSFPDYPITNFNFLPESKMLQIDLEGGWLDINSGIRLGRGFLRLTNWNTLTIRYYDDDTDLWCNPDFSSVDVLKEICEFKVEGLTVYLSGFGKNFGCWNEWQIENPLVAGQFCDKKLHCIDLLLNQNATEAVRSDAADDLNLFEDTEVVNALIQVASDSSENTVTADYCAKSLGKIFSKGNLYNQKLIEKLTPRARKIVNDIIRDKNPSLLK